MTYRQQWTPRRRPALRCCRALDDRIVAKIAQDAALPPARVCCDLRREVEVLRTHPGPLRTAALNVRALAVEADRTDPDTTP